MGNMKYPLNGRYMTLGDLIQEFGFNTACSSTNIIKESLEDIKNTVATLLTDTSNNSNSDNVFAIDAAIWNNISTENNEIFSIYESFRNDILKKSGNNTTLEPAIHPYEIVFFPTVYSTEERNNDNTKYKIILEGDDAIYSPDVYLKLKDVTNLSRLSQCIIRPFHYICDSSVPDVITDSYGKNVSPNSGRFLFNYKRSNGESTAAYALRQFIKVYNYIKDYDNLRKNIFKDINIDTLLFSSITDASLTYPVSVNNRSISYPIGGLLCNFYKDDILDNDNNVKSTAYRYIANIDNYTGSYYELDNNYNINYIDSTDSDLKLTFNDYLKSKFFNDTDIPFIDASVYYYEYDSSETYLDESEELTYNNLYNQLCYYATMLIGSLKYKTGLICDAKYDVISGTTYKSEDPLYRCDIGADTTIIGVSVIDNGNINWGIYGLPATKLTDQDKIIINIPINVKSALNPEGTNTTYYRSWTIKEIKNLLRKGAQLKDGTTVLYEYMKLMQNGQNVFDNNNIDKINDTCMSSLNDIQFPPDVNMLVNSKDDLKNKSLLEYNSETNPSYDTTRIINSNNEKLFIGTLNTLIVYNNRICFTVDIPIYRLANYYYTEQTPASRTIYGSFNNIDVKINANLFNFNYTDNLIIPTIYYNAIDTIIICSTFNPKYVTTYITNEVKTTESQSVVSYSKGDLYANNNIISPISNTDNIYSISLLPGTPTLNLVFNNDENNTYTININPTTNTNMKVSSSVIYNYTDTDIFVKLSNIGNNIIAYSGKISKNSRDIRISYTNNFIYDISVLGSNDQKLNDKTYYIYYEKDGTIMNINSSLNEHSIIISNDEIHKYEFIIDNKTDANINISYSNFILSNTNNIQYTFTIITIDNIKEFIKIENADGKDIKYDISSNNQITITITTPEITNPEPPEITEPETPDENTGDNSDNNE